MTDRAQHQSPLASGQPGPTLPWEQLWAAMNAGRPRGAGGTLWPAGGLSSLLPVSGTALEARLFFPSARGRSRAAAALWAAAGGRRGEAAGPGPQHVGVGVGAGAVLLGRG